MHTIWLDEAEKRMFLIASCMILFAIMLAFFNMKITGMMIGGENTILLTVLPSENSCMMFYVKPSQSVVEGTTISFVIYCENCGSTKTRGTTKITIIDENNNTIYSAASLEYELDHNSYHKFTSEWYATTVGKYTAEAYCMIGNETINTRIKKIEVFPKPVPGELQPGVVPTPPQKPGIEIRTQEGINASQASKIPLLIGIVNTGNVALHNILLNLSVDEDLRVVSITPTIVSKLKVGEEALYVAVLEISPEAELGEHRIIVHAVADEITANKSIIVNVSFNSLKEKAEQMIEYYTKILLKLEEEVNGSASAGYDVSKARYWLDKGFRDLKAAKKLYELWMYEEAINKLDDVNEDIRNAVDELSKAKAAPKLPEEIILPAWLPKILVYVVLLLVSAVVMIMIALVKRRKRYIVHHRFVPVRKW